MPNESPFDPCRQWLGIDAVDLGNARLVLGVSRQEVDPLAVLRAAEARLNLLRTISPGPFEMARAGLIKRVEEAREKLLAEIAASPPRPRPDAAVTFAMPVPPSQRAATVPPDSPTYPGVAGDMAASMPPAVPAARPPMPPAVPGGGFGADGGATIAIRTTVYRKKTPVAGIALTIVALSAVVGGLFSYTLYGRKNAGKPRAAKAGERQTARAEPEGSRGGAESVAGRKSASAEQADRRKDEEPLDPRSDRAVSTSKPPSPGKERQRRSPPASESKPAPEPKPDPDPAPEPEPASKPGAKPEREPVSDGPPAREVMPKPAAADDTAAEEMQAGRKPPEFNPDGVMAEENSELDATLAESLEALRRQEYDTVTRLLATAFKQANGPQARQRVAGWQQLATYYKGFMGYREKALAAVKSGDEYDVKDQKISIVEVDDDRFVFRSAGGNKTVPRDKIPAGIVLAIVMQWFDANPANNLYIGAYHLAKPEPDPARAREHWDQAEAANADASGLMPLLDDPVFATSE